MNRSVHKDTCRIWDRGVCNCGPINAAPESRDAGGAAPSADSDGGAELPQVDANNSGLAMKLADGREVRARLSVDGGSVCFDLTATNAAHTKIALSFEAIESMRLLANRLAAAQECGEAVAPEAKPEWPKGAFFTDGEGNFYDEQAEPLDHAFAPPAPPAPLPGKRERALFQAWARDRHWNLSLRADGERYMSESTQEGWYAWKGRAALSAQAAPEYRTGFDEAPSTFNQEDAAPADYPPTVSKEQALEGLNRAIERLQMDIDDGSRPDQWSMQAIQENIRIGRRFIEQSGRERVSADPLPNRVSLSLGPVAFQFTSHQQWVNKAQSWFANLAAENPNAARKRYLCIDAKGRVCMIGKDFGRARDEDAFPVKLYLIDAAPPQHQVKKGEPS